MLVIEKKKNPVHEALFIVATYLLIGACVVWIVAMSNESLRRSCQSIPLRDYQVKSSTTPPTCLNMWKNGQL